MKKLRVGVIYGGRSGEHEVSLASAAAVFKNLDPGRYEAVPIRIEKDGRWALPDRPPLLISAADVIQSADQGVEVTREALMTAHPGGDTLLMVDSVARPHDEDRSRPGPSITSGIKLDVVFPVLHGPYGEDGTIQGLLELANIPYVGGGVLASSVGMDKALSKLVFAAKGLPVSKYLVVLRKQWAEDPERVSAAVTGELGYPVFVKPANLGSSVGISKVKSAAELKAAIDAAAEFDRKLVIEAAVPNAREI